MITKACAEVLTAIGTFRTTTEIRDVSEMPQKEGALFFCPLFDRSSKSVKKILCEVQKIAMPLPVEFPPEIFIRAIPVKHSDFFGEYDALL